MFFEYILADAVQHEAKYVTYSLQASDTADSSREGSPSFHQSNSVTYRLRADDQAGSEVDDSGSGS